METANTSKEKDCYNQRQPNKVTDKMPPAAGAKDSRIGLMPVIQAIAASVLTVLLVWVAATVATLPKSEVVSALTNKFIQMEGKLSNIESSLNATQQVNELKLRIAGSDLTARLLVQEAAIGELKADMEQVQSSLRDQIWPRLRAQAQGTRLLEQVVEQIHPDVRIDLPVPKIEE